MQPPAPIRCVQYGENPYGYKQPPALTRSVQYDENRIAGSSPLHHIDVYRMMKNCIAVSSPLNPHTICWNKSKLVSSPGLRIPILLKVAHLHREHISCRDIPKMLHDKMTPCLLDTILLKLAHLRCHNISCSHNKLWFCKQCIQYFQKISSVKNIAKCQNGLCGLC